MSEQFTTPDPIELMHLGFQAVSAGNLDEALRLFTEDVVVDMTRTVGIVVHGRDAFRAFQEDWLAGYDEVAYATEEIVDAGNGVTFVRVLQTARPKGTAGRVTQRESNVFISDEGRVVRITLYPESELGEARADAKRLAEERGWAMAQAMELVRSISAAHERGDYGSAEWAHPDIEYVIVGGPTAGRWRGRAAMASAARELFSVWEEHRSVVEEVRALDGERVLVLTHGSGRGKTSGVELDATQWRVAALYQVRDRQVIRHVVYLDRTDAFADLGLTE